MLKLIASLLDGMEYGHQIPKDIRALAKANRIVIVYGASDDLMEFDGAIIDERGAYNGGVAYINADGLYSPDERCLDCKHTKAAFAVSQIITAIWCGENGYSWEYKTNIPHTTFEILEDREKYCRGIVFCLDNLEIDGIDRLPKWQANEQINNEMEEII